MVSLIFDRVFLCFFLVLFVSQCGICHSRVLTPSKSKYYINDKVIVESYVDEYDSIVFDNNFYNTTNARLIYKSSIKDALSRQFTSNNNITKEENSNSENDCKNGNPIDDCWRCNSNWHNQRHALATCVIGFGKNAIGGKDGKDGQHGEIYIVTSDSDDVENPQPGTLRYGVTRDEPLWIIFANSMTIQLRGELRVSSYKTIDGRGANIHINAQVTIKGVEHVIVHGLHIHDIVQHPISQKIRISPTKLVTYKSFKEHNFVEGPGKDGIQIWSSNNVWIDHCYLSSALDGLLDVSKGSTDITISNNYFTNHDKVMLLGSSPKDTQDKNMRVTVAFNKFGPGLIQRMPRTRYGVFHILNNDYSNGWDMYAIGGSENPTILSEGNYFSAGEKKEITKHIKDGDGESSGWKNWNWASSGDVFLNGAYFTGSGANLSSSETYTQVVSTTSHLGKDVPTITKNAGPFSS